MHGTAQVGLEELLVASLDFVRNNINGPGSVLGVYEVYDGLRSTGS